MSLIFSQVVLQINLLSDCIYIWYILIAKPPMCRKQELHCHAKDERDNTWLRASIVPGQCIIIPITVINKTLRKLINKCNCCWGRAWSIIYIFNVADGMKIKSIPLSLHTLSELEDLLSPNRRLQLSCDKKIFRCWIDHQSSFHKCINTYRAVPRKPFCATLSMPTVEYKHIECFLPPPAFKRNDRRFVGERPERGSEGKLNFHLKTNRFAKNISKELTAFI